jgi:hypothetical protein
MGGIPNPKKKENLSINNYITWFEIPAVNFQQAVYFYNTIYDIKMEQQINQVNAIAFFPASSGVGGAIISGPGSTPSNKGPLIYLNGGKDLNNVLNKVEASGGRIVMPKTPIGADNGFFAIFIDNQGNKLALHSKK